MKFQLHVTALNMLSKCGEQFRRRYIEGERHPPSISAVIGTAVDHAVTGDLDNKIMTGELLPAEDVLDDARDTLMSEWRKGVELSEEDADDGIEGSQGEAIDASVALAGLHHRQVAPRLNPTHVQRRWVLDIDGLGVQLAGTIDVQEALISIRDTKTSAKSPNRDTADVSLQLTTYALAVKAHDGACPKEANLDYLVRTPKRKELKVVPLVSKRTDADFAHLLARVQHAEQIIQSGIFTPAPLDAWWCTKKFCGYWQTCPYAKRPVSVTAVAK